MLKLTGNYWDHGRKGRRKIKKMWVRAWIKNHPDDVGNHVGRKFLRAHVDIDYFRCTRGGYCKNWDHLKYFFQSCVGMHMDEAYSKFCKKYPKHKYHVFLDCLSLDSSSYIHYRRGQRETGFAGIYVDDEGILRDRHSDCYCNTVGLKFSRYKKTEYEWNKEHIKIDKEDKGKLYIGEGYVTYYHYSKFRPGIPVKIWSISAERWDGMTKEKRTKDQALLKDYIRCEVAGIGIETAKIRHIQWQGRQSKGVRYFITKKVASFPYI